MYSLMIGSVRVHVAPIALAALRLWFHLRIAPLLSAGWDVAGDGVQGPALCVRAPLPRDVMQSMQ